MPYRLVGQTVWIRSGARTVELFTADHQLVATHDRARQPGDRLTTLAHLPPHKVPGLTASRATCRTQAEAIGPATTELVGRLLDHRPEDRLKIAQRVLRLGTTFGAERLERACARALFYDSPEYPTLKRILATGLDQAALDAATAPTRAAASPSPDRPVSWSAGCSEDTAMTASDLPQQLAPHLRRLRLYGILDTLEVRTQQAIAEQWSYVEFLARPIEDEAERREHKRLELRCGAARWTRPRRWAVRLRLQPEHQPPAGVRPRHLHVRPPAPQRTDVRPDGRRQDPSRPGRRP